MTTTQKTPAPVATPVRPKSGKPVLSSNQALAWHMLRLAGIDDGFAGFGRLFQLGG